MPVVGIGDTIAVIEVCIRLAKLVQDCQHVSGSYDVSVRTLKSLLKTCLNVSETLSQGRANKFAVASPAAQARLTAEVESANVALKACATILQKRYVLLSSSQRPLLWVRLRRNLEWSRTQQRYDEQLKVVQRSLDSINAIVGVQLW